MIDRGVITLKNCIHKILISSICIFAMSVCGCARNQDIEPELEESNKALAEKLPTAEDETTVSNEFKAFAQREDEIIVLTEENSVPEVEDYALYFMRSQDKVRVTIQSLSVDPEKRAGELQNIKTEMMSGKGPDVFLLSVNDEQTFESDRHEPIFPNINKSLQSGFFEPLNKYMENDDFWNDSPVKEGFLKACQYNDNQYALPLACSYHVFYTLEGTKMKLGHNISDFSRAISKSKDEQLKYNCWQLSWLASNLFQPAVDYETQKTLFSKSAWVDYVEKHIIPYEKWKHASNAERSSLDELGGITHITNMVSSSDLDINCCKAIPGLDGDAVAKIRFWGAMGRNSDHKQEAYDFLMLFLNCKVADENTTKEGEWGSYVATDESLGGYIPIYEEAFQKYLKRLEVPENKQELILDSFRELDTLYFPTEIETEVYEKLQKMYLNIEWRMHEDKELSKKEQRKEIEEIADYAEKKYEMLAKE